MDHIIDRSPDQQHTLLLRYENEIRFGPAYFRAVIDEQELAGRIFGDVWKWSDDSRYLGLQEWLTTDYQKGPQTALLIIDFRAQREVRASSANKGFISPIQFQGSTVIYRKSYLATGKIAEYEMDLEVLDRWTPF